MLVPLAALLAAGCITIVDPYKFVCPGSPQARVKKKSEIDRMVKLLNPRDKNLVLAYLSQDAQAQPEPDRTIRDIVLLEDDRQGEAQRNALLPRPQAPTAGQVQINNLVEVRLLNKQAILSQPGKISAGDQLVITLGILNKSSKGISALSGLASVVNADGVQLSTVNVSRNDHLASCKGLSWQETLNLSPQDKGLLDTPTDQIKISFAPQLVVFDDGTRMGK